MNSQAIASLLQNSLDPNPAVRQPAEQQLLQYEKAPGYHAGLLELITINELPIHIKQAAIVHLKNIVKRYWTIREGATARISPNDRKLIKDNILEAVIFQKVPLVRVQLLEVCYWCIRGDFPGQWPGLLPAIMQNCQSSDKVRVYGAMSVLLKVYKMYPYKPDEERDVLVNETFPTLQTIFQAVVTGTSPDAFEMQRIIVKIFYLATQMSLPTFIKNPAVAKVWFGMLLHILEAKLPQDQCPSDIEELGEHPLWVAKKWVTRILNRMFTRFGRENYVADETKGFAKMFYEEMAPVILEAFLKVLQARSKGEPITDWVLQLTYNFIDSAVTHSALYKLMKPHLHFILLENVFQTLCLSQADLEMWQENPQEFVRKSLDVMEEFHDPKVAAQNLLINLVKVRTRDSLELVLNAVQQILVNYNNTQLQSAIHKDAALRMIGCLRKLLSGNEKFKKPIEELLINQVFPEFQSNFGFLRARAAWLIGQFSKFEFTNPAHFEASISMTCNALIDKELPVKLEAAMAISRLVHNEAVPQYLKPKVPLLLEHFFKIIDEVGNEEIVLTLGTLIGQIGEDIAPYAIEITQRLSQMFLTLIKADQEDDESALTAVQCLRSINTILWSLETLPDAYGALEEVCKPLMELTICEEGIEYFDDILEMMTLFLNFGKGASPFMWSLVPRIVKAFNEWARDYMSNILPPLDCLISRGVDFFVSNPQVMQLILSMPQTLLAGTEESHETDARWGCKLLECIVVHCKGRIDNIIPDIIKLAATKLFIAKDMQLKLLLLDVIACCAYYNPMLFVAILKQGGGEFEQNLFNHWLSHLEDMSKVKKHQKVSILGLSSLLHLPIAELPALLKQSYGAVLDQLLLLCGRYKAVCDSGAGDTDEEEGFYEDEEDEVLDLDENQDADDAIEDVHNFTQQLSAELLGFEFRDDDIDEEMVDSPLDDIEPFMFFAQSLENFASREGAFYQQWEAEGPKKNQIAILVQEAQKRKFEEEQRKAEEALEEKN